MAATKIYLLPCVLDIPICLLIRVFLVPTILEARQHNHRNPLPELEYALDQHDIHMQLFGYNVQLFMKDSYLVEKAAYRALKRLPLTTNVTYLAVPWLRYIGKKLHQQVYDDLKKLHFDNAFTVCFGYVDDMFDVFNAIGVKTVFTPRASTEQLTVGNVAIEPIPYCALHGIGPAKRKDVLCSFVGSLSTHHVREDMAKLLGTEKDFVIQGSEAWRDVRTRETFQTILSRSRFSLCPRGYAPNSIRFWESLEAGAIPILISDTARLPVGFDWSTCVIHIREHDIVTIPEVLRAIKPKQEEAMRSACLRAHRWYAGEHCVRSIRLYYGE